MKIRNRRVRESVSDAAVLGLSAEQVVVDSGGQEPVGDEQVRPDEPEGADRSLGIGGIPALAGVFFPEQMATIERDWRLQEEEEKGNRVSQGNHVASLWLGVPNSANTIALFY